MDARNRKAYGRQVLCATAAGQNIRTRAPPTIAAPTELTATGITINRSEKPTIKPSESRNPAITAPKTKVARQIVRECLDNGRPYESAAK
jgi:hypothetical protein